MDDINPQPDEEEAAKNDTSSSVKALGLLVCQACLSTQACVQLSAQLALAFYKTGVFSEGPLPRYLCVACIATLTRWCRFRDECQKSQLKLDIALKKYSEPIEYINGINNNGRGLIHNLSITDTVLVDNICTESKTKHNSTDPITTSKKRTNNSVVKYEHDSMKIEDYDNDNINNENDDNCDNDIEDNDAKRFTDNDVEEFVEVKMASPHLKLEDEKEEKRLRSRTRAKSKTRRKKAISERSKSAESSGSDDDEALIVVVGRKRRKETDAKRNPKKSRPTKKKTIKKAKHKNKGDTTKPEDELPRKVAKPFRSTEGALFFKYFDTKLLSKKEQIAELEKRKSTKNYVKAPFKCEHCAKGFLDKFAYDLHCKAHEEIENGYKCEICAKCYRNYKSFKAHQTLHTEIITCKKCDYKTNSRYSAVLHIKWHEGKEYRCELCPQVYTRHTTLLTHIRLKHPSQHVCYICGYCFLGELGLKAHYTKAHPNYSTESAPDGPTCTECGIQFATQHALDTHLKVSPKHGLVMKLNDPSSERINNKRKRKPRPTVQCSPLRKKRGRVTLKTREDSLKISEASKGERKPTDGKRGPLERDEIPAIVSLLECDKCGHRVTSEHGYNMHLAKAHPEDVPRNESKHLLCELCGKTYKHQFALDDHMNEHTGVAPHACPCGATFTRREALYAHRRRHERRGKYPCPLCSWSFDIKGNRDRHYIYVHNGVLDVKCQFCEKLFKTTAARRLHTEHFHNKKPYPKRVRARRRRAPGASDRDRDEMFFQAAVAANSP